MKKFPKGFEIKKFFEGIKRKKLFGFKNLLIIALAGMLVILICCGIGAGFGGGAGSGESDGTSKITEDGESSSVMGTIVEIITPTTEPREELTEEPVEEQTGVNGLERTVLVINVVENDYFYNNERILREDFIEIVKGVEGEVVVEVKDDNASLKAYKGLLKELDEINIDYIEN